MKNLFVDSDKTFVVSDRSSGQVMAEALIAITITVIGLLGIFSLTSRSLSLNQTVSGQYIGSNLAMEGLEVVKNLIDRTIIQHQTDPTITFGKGIDDGIYEIAYNDIALGRQISPMIDNCGPDYVRENGTELTLDENSGLYGYGFQKNTGFKRAVCIKNISVDGRSDKIQVNSIVAWTGRGNSRSDINLEDYFFNW